MSLISGPVDGERLAALPEEERAYCEFVVRLCGEVLDSRPRQTEALGVAASALTALGRYAAGLALDRRLAAIRPDDPMVLYNLACSLSLTGGADAAFDVLAEAVRHGYRDARHLRHDPDLAPIRGDPRFGMILTAIGNAGPVVGRASSD